MESKRLGDIEFAGEKNGKHRALPWSRIKKKMDVDVGEG